MAGSAIFSYQLSPDGKVLRLQWACTTAAAGGSPELTSPTVTQSGDTGFCKHNSPFTGTIFNAEVKPDGVAPPTAAFDVKLKDPDDSTVDDYLGGVGSNCSATATTKGIPAEFLFSKRLIPYAENCGNSKIFTLSVDIDLG